MSTEPSSPRPSSSIRELESLRIARKAEKRPGRLVPVLVALLVIAGGAAIGYQVYARTLGRPPEVQTALVTIKQAGEPGTLLTGSGYIVTQHKYITVGTKQLGQIVAEPIEEGQHIKKGDILARIDDGDYQAQLRQAIADRDLAQADIKLYSAQADRQRALFQAGVATRDQLDMAENKLNEAHAALEKDLSEIDYWKFLVNQCVIRSPINGLVLTKIHEVGDMITYASGANAGGGVTDIAQIADTEDMRAEVDINESDIAKVTMGMPASVILDAYPDRAFDARVVKIYPEADRQKGTVKVEVHILSPDLAIIKPEMSAKISFLGGSAVKQEAPALVLVPKKAIVEDGNRKYVWVVRTDAAHRTEVSVGREYQDGVQVLQGLSGGETVIVVPPTQLHDGQPVTPQAS
ncbi:MAG: efflux RND transporter periplasmic adaptor subunit [Deltaproteobacteria bacterium]|jgi:RND family efflux transporter MFP subunit|nr:efflux RND transporter periplasmic adaptor subunit [Deltaproteobacteria bacterium]